MTDCPKCGTAVQDGAEHCHECGLRIEGSTQSFDPVGESDAASPATAESPEGPVLVVRKGPEVGERFYIDRDRITIGRDPASDIFLNDVTVSRSHAVVTKTGDTVSIKDTGSLNGIYVNGSCVDETMLSPGDAVQLGTFQMVFLAGGEIA
jgi:pSer/pThr/pTyr-binding forkhead associated (FHA) protein